MHVGFFNFVAIEQQMETDKKQVFTEKVFLPFCDGNKPLSEKLTNLLYQKFTVENSNYQNSDVWNTIEHYFITKVIPHKIEVRKVGIELLRHNWFVRLLSLADFYTPENPIETFKYNLEIHDLSKFSLHEAYGYAVHDFKNPAPTLTIFKNAWHHHKLNNPHHPEYWFDVEKNGKATPLPMPSIYIGEMVADWLGASQSYGQNLEDWLSKNLPQFFFHPYTANTLQNYLSKMGFNVVNNGQQLSIK